MSSSDGWPLTGPNEIVRRWPLTSLPEDERQQKERPRRPPPTCTCTGGARGRSGRRSPALPARIIDSDSQTSWTSASPSSAPKKRWTTRSCGSRSISSRLMPAEQADGGQQHLVGPPAGQHLGEVDAEQDAEIDDQVDRLGGREVVADPELRLLPGEPERDTADEDRRRDDPEQLELAPARTRRIALEDRREGRCRRRSSGGLRVIAAVAPAASGPGRAGARRRSRAARRPRSGRR